MADQTPAAPSTPRSLLSCKRAGVNPADLIYKPRQEFEKKYSDKDVANLHYEKSEMQRQFDIKSVQRNYNDIISNGITEAEFNMMQKSEVLKPLVKEFIQLKKTDFRTEEQILNEIQTQVMK